MGLVKSTNLVNEIQPKQASNQDKSIVWHFKDQLELKADSFSLNSVEKNIFNVILDAGSKGTKPTSLKHVLNVTQKDLNVALKRLEFIGLIKKARPGKKVYFHRCDVELDESLTGGFWQNDDLKPDFSAINGGRQVCAKCLADKIAERFRNNPTNSILMGVNVGMSSKEITEYIAKHGFFNDQNPKERDIEAILETMRFDDLVNFTERNGRKLYYLVKNSYPELTGYSHVPCSVCPVKDVCEINANINPNSCQYLKDWLDEF